MRFKIRYVAATNLRGFRDSTLPINDDVTYLVGPNNSGKTSILRLLDWILTSASLETLDGDLPLTESEIDLLLPARETRNAARRLTLGIEILDGRHRTRYPHADGLVVLRVGVTAAGAVRLNVGPPKTGEARDAKNRSRALELLERLRAETVLTLIPSSRDASSESFREALRAASTAKLEERALHSKQAGAPAEYRALKRAVEEIDAVAKQLVEPLWDEMQTVIPSGLVEGAALGPEIDANSIIEWLAERTSLRLTTGEHDALTVSAVEVGSGLQSLLELAINRAGGAGEGVTWLIAMEEPEAFLHPAAQRSLSRMLLETPAQLIVSTHSQVLVDEARFGQLTLVRNHRFFPPSIPTSSVKREEINSALLTGQGAEMAFASSLLLVEGEGDRLFFEGLRRRLAIEVDDADLDELFAVSVGSKASFAPWLALLRGYGEENNRPIRWMVVADQDAGAEVRQAHANAGITLPRRLLQAIERQQARHAEQGSYSAIRNTTRTVNRQARKAGIRLALLPGDLEGSMIRACPDETVAELAAAIGHPELADRNALRVWLGNHKNPWIRAEIAAKIPLSEISRDIAEVIVAWLEGPKTRNAARALLRKVRDD